MAIKKVVIAFSILLFAEFPLIAQIDTFRVGVYGGSGICYLRNQSIFPVVSVGAFFQRNFSKYVSIFAGLGYTRLQENNLSYYAPPPYFAQSSQSYGANAREYIHYLSLPVMVKAYVDDEVRIFIEGGVFLNPRVNATEIDYYSSQGYSNVRSNASFNFTSVDFGFTVGIGIDIPIGKNFGLIIEERNDIGVIDIFTPEGIDDYSSSKTCSISCVGLLGFYYSLNKKSKLSTSAAK